MMKENIAPKHELLSRNNKFIYIVASCWSLS